MFFSNNMIFLLSNTTFETSYMCADACSIHFKRRFLKNKHWFSKYIGPKQCNICNINFRDALSKMATSAIKQHFVDQDVIK